MLRDHGQSLRAASVALVVGLLGLGAFACVGSIGPDPGGGGDDPMNPVDPNDPVPPPPGATCATDRAVLDVDAARPVALMPRERLQRVADALPCVLDPALKAILESEDTLFYDRTVIIPGYQDSFGDNVIAPIGMRPNTISPSLIDTAVPGGHAQIFEKRGVFHFPFGNPAGFEDEGFVVDFWKLPRDGESLLPVVWWMREPNDLTHRIEWLFPVGTVFGELLFLSTEDGEWVPFEIRTRTRVVDGWNVDVYRPFGTADALAVALEEKRAETPAWQSDPEIDALVAHLRDPETLIPARVAATHFRSAFPAIDGAKDELPGLSDNSILHTLLGETPFSSVRGVVWKQSGGLLAWAPTTSARTSIVPRNYNGGFFSVDEATCDVCHRDAGRPFKYWYENILAYGELWGQDEIFSWHPFENSTFVDAQGNVVDFNYDNRTFRDDFVSAGLLEAYDPTRHPDTRYQQIQREWTNYRY